MVKLIERNPVFRQATKIIQNKEVTIRLEQYLVLILPGDTYQMRSKFSDHLERSQSAIDPYLAFSMLGYSPFYQQLTIKRYVHFP